MFLHRLNGHFLPVKYTRGQGRFHIGLFKYLWEVLNLSGTTGGNDRDGHRFTDMFDQLDVKATIGTVLINAVQQYLTGTQLLTGLYQLDCVDVASFPATFDGALIPADLGTLFEKLILSNKLLDFSEWFLTVTQPRPNRRRYW